MIVSFAGRRTERFYDGERVKQFEPFRTQAMRRLTILDEAESIEVLMGLPSNHLEALPGDRDGQYSIRINEQWRICFRWEDGDVCDVEIVDYH